MRWLLPFVLVACATEPEGPQISSGVIYKDFPISISRRADVLFVIDDAQAMEPYAANTRANLGRFVSTLRASQYGFPDLRLGVVAGDGKSLRTDPSMLGRFAVDFVGPDANRIRNYDGDLADVFARLSDVGTSATSSQPLSAARAALEANASFVRDNAAMFVFVISATDAPVIEGEKLAVFLRSLHDDGYSMAVGGIVPEGAQGIGGLLDRFPNRAVRAAIDDPDWASKVFAMITQSYRTSLGSPCIEGPLVDLEVLRPGLQPACTAEYSFPIGGEVLPPCVGDLVGTRCFRIVENPFYCPTTSFGESRLFKIDQPRVDIPDGTHMLIQCLSSYDE